MLGTAWFQAFRLCLQSVVQETGSGCEGRTAGRIGQTMNANRTAHADLLVENEGRKLPDAAELTAAATGINDPLFPGAGMKPPRTCRRSSSTRSTAVTSRSKTIVQRSGH